LFLELSATATILNEELVKSADKAIARVLHDVKEAIGSDRRRAQRMPFFREISIEVDGRQLSAFSRDLSSKGIGLLHRTPVNPGEITVSIPWPGGMIRQRTLIVWCHDVGEGWYASGGRFVDD
jgi:hypothetical protein